MADPTVRKRRLGSELRRLREAAGLKLDDVAARTSLTVSKVSRIEVARIGVKADDLDSLLDQYGVDDGAKRDVLHSLARHGSQRGWWQTYRDIISPAYADLISLEADAVNMRTYQSTLIPGLLQTAAYARAAISAINMTSTPPEVDALVEVRKARQSVLTRPDPMELWAIIHEGALRPRDKGNPQMMREQLQHLLDIQRLPHVSIQVLPLDAPPHVGMSGSFAVLGFPETSDLDVVHIESLTSALYVEDPAEVSRYGGAFERLRAAALPFDESADLIARTKDNIQ
ncbi:helix-turn-helix transcriptional regulator [Streptomyces scabiei]|uniref:helix-turn-helix domain-containing protein n=1 Tax=Streptomyces scabiei TaxID=1930 RepID=UPI0029B2DA8C|nr:helix-turn-helix transcriptional regulator [Streptomyces scabiei]MDX2575955.1 helix-turn-helix transcriptional regulator [Streptomyces scabiei]MDX2885572.1 helix-turn-helix transcriptional regulator [Streptomyces scabiei]MDX2993475.1 helix-turn-helix transcriptional regulator [Streptomyces scabiei]MDX3028410.1 helix-turn-helix transcriptional regulator [Streptomyces scabiei]MDX3047255.1 helix-turn-helix transcriptional regulator [Streptomyces scabiei]